MAIDAQHLKSLYDQYDNVFKAKLEGLLRDELDGYLHQKISDDVCIAVNGRYQDVGGSTVEEVVRMTDEALKTFSDYKTTLKDSYTETEMQEEIKKWSKRFEIATRAIKDLTSILNSVQGNASIYPMNHGTTDMVLINIQPACGLDAIEKCLLQLDNNT